MEKNKIISLIKLLKRAITIEFEKGDKVTLIIHESLLKYLQIGNFTNEKEKILKALTGYTVKYFKEFNFEFLYAKYLEGEYRELYEFIDHFNNWLQEEMMKINL